MNGHGIKPAKLPGWDQGVVWCDSFPGQKCISAKKDIPVTLYVTTVYARKCERPELEM